ncbi:hypothetical protein ACQ4PT_068284 [Festuca glaucescens]
MEMAMESDKEMEMEMEAGEGMSWKALFERRVVMADAHCRNADSLLHGLVVIFTEHEARDMRACGGEEARRGLEDAHAQLGLAVANMGAARHLALRCAGRRALDPGSDPSTSTPPLSHSSSSVADPEARHVLSLLREATELVYRVHDLVEGARGHMGAAESLLLALGLGGDDGGRDRGSAPWVHPPCVAEQLDGTMDLGEAFARALDLLKLTTEAGEAAFRVGEDRGLDPCFGHLNPPPHGSVAHLLCSTSRFGGPSACSISFCFPRCSVRDRNARRHMSPALVLNL